MFGLKTFELFLIAAVAVLLFGWRSPNLARSLGRGFEEFRRGLHVDEAIDHRAKHALRSSVRDLLIVIFLIVVIVVLAMFGLNSVELLVIGTVLAMLLGARLPRPPAFGRLGKVDDFHRGAQFDRSPSWFGHTLFIAAVAIEAVLLVIVLYDRFIR